MKTIIVLITATFFITAGAFAQSDTTRLVTTDTVKVSVTTSATAQPNSGPDVSDNSVRFPENIKDVEYDSWEQYYQFASQTEAPLIVSQTYYHHSKRNGYKTAGRIRPQPR